MSALRGVGQLAIVLSALAGAATNALAQGTVETFHVQGNVHLVLGAGANVAVQVGDEGVLVVDTGSRVSRDALLPAIKKLSDRPIRWIVKDRKSTRLNSSH